MDTATVFQIISIVSFSLSGILFIAAVLMFIKLNIPIVIGDLSGKTAEKQIKAIRERNVANGNRRFRPSLINMDNGMTPGFAEGIKGVNEEEKTDIIDMATEILPLENEVLEEKTELLAQFSGTSVLSETEAKKITSSFEIIKDIIIVHTDEVIL